MITLTTSENLASLPLPRIPATLTKRQRLIDRISDHHAVTLLTAPTGFGKTTALAVWLEERFASKNNHAATIAWVEGSKVAALKKSDELLTTLSEKLASSSDPLVLLIDRYDEIPDREWDAHLLDLVRHNRHLHVIMTGRDPERHLRWQALDLDIQVLTGKELSFTAAETQKLLQKIHPEITDSAAQEIHEQVGGWPILVRAVAFAGGDLKGAIDYLQSGTFEHTIAQESLSFAKATACTLDFTEEMAAFLTGSEEIVDTLDKFQAAGVVQKFKKNGQTRYRYLPIIANAAMAEISETERKSHLIELAHWCSANDLGEDAVYYAVKSEQWDELPAILQEHWHQIGESQVLREILAKIDPEVVAKQPVTAGLLDILAGPERRTGEVPHIAEPRTDDLGETLANLITQAAYARFNGDFAAARAGFAEIEALLTAAANVPEMAPMIPPARLQAAILSLLRDELRQCATQATAVYRGARDHDLDTMMRNALGILALINVFGGNGQHAAEWLQRLDKLPPPEGVFKEMVDTCAHAARVLIEVGQLDFAAAERALARLNPATSMDEMWPFIVLAQADYALLTGKAAQGIRDLEAALIAHPNFDHPDTLIQPIIAASRANLFLAQGEGNRALASLAGADGNHPLVRTVRARIELFRGEHQRAIVIARTVSPLDQTHDRALRELRLITAVAQLRAGAPDQAARIFSQFIADDGVGMLRALALMDRTAVEELVQISGVGAQEFATVLERVPKPPFIAKVEVATLTPREQLVLDLLYQNLTINQVARKLVVSINTVKSQVRSIYRKLEVSSRADALKRAADYGLIG